MPTTVANFQEMMSNNFKEEQKWRVRSHSSRDSGVINENKFFMAIKMIKAGGPFCCYPELL